MHLRSLYLGFLAALHVHSARLGRLYVFLFAFVFIVLVLIFLFLSPPFAFPRGIEFEVSEDATLSEVARDLETHGIIRSAFVMKLVGRLFKADTRLQAGLYRFEEPLGVTSILYRLEAGISGIPVIAVTFPEGSTVREMALLLTDTFQHFDSAEFQKLAKPYEGVLFPDTYHFREDVAPHEVLASMRATYESRITEIQGELDASGIFESDAIIMASLLEKEAKTFEEQRMVAGILWNRIQLDMPLQVDAVFGYIRDTNTYHPSLEDLEIASPYNTYRNRGLPPGPIGNPGLSSVRAAITPLSTSYLYYLSGKDGQMHYARTFEEHKENKRNYLK
ncbi:MAG: endolytic transglycosylase MltG [Minisyncoccia bacterium]